MNALADILTPANVEQKLFRLSRELDTAHNDLVHLEREYHLVKQETEVALAKARIENRECKRVQEIDDRAVIACESLLFELAVAEAKVKAARANAARIRTQVDIVRSIGTSVRSAMDLQ